jgi:hypothetical protein
VVGLAVLWVWARSRTPGPGPARPSVVLERLASGPVLRVALVLAWMWVGWHLFARWAPSTARRPSNLDTTADQAQCSRHPGWRAPRLQPDFTEHETAAAQAVRMEHSDEDTGRVMTEGGETLPDLDPWRQVGWIFREDGCVAIARRGEELHHGARADWWW